MEARDLNTTGVFYYCVTKQILTTLNSDWNWLASIGSLLLLNTSKYQQANGYYITVQYFNNTLF